MKTLRVIQLVILLIIIAALVVVMTLGMTGNISIPIGNILRKGSFSNSVLIYDQVYDGTNLKFIETDLSSADLEYHFSQNSELRVVYYGPENEKDSPLVKTKYENDRLEIKQHDRISVFNMISGEKLIVYLPADFDKEIAGHTASGNILFNEDISLNKLSLKLSSGNVKLKKLITDDADITVSSGTISADSIIASTYNFRMSSGNFKTAEIEGAGDISSTSGNTDIKSYKGGGSIKSTSGNIDIGILSLDSDLEISLTSGNVSADLPTAESAISYSFDVLSGSIRTNLGSVSKNITGASFRQEHTNSQAPKLSIETTSGNIRANVR